MSRDILSAQRLKKSLDKLEGCPVLPPEPCREFESFAGRLSENQKSAATWQKLDAALEDPRWLVDRA